MKTLLQFVLSILRYLGIDVYKIYIGVRQLRLWNQSVPKRKLRNDGICLAFDVFQLTSFSQVGRDFVDMLSKTSIPFEVFNTDLGIENGTYIQKFEQEKYSKYLTPVIRQEKVITFTVWPLAKSKKFTNIIVPFYEFETGFNRIFPEAFKRIDYAIPTSDFCTTLFTDIAPSSVLVKKIRYPFVPRVNTLTPRNEIRAKYSIQSSSFVAIYNFSYGSSYERKNPIAVLRAFSKAFSTLKNTYLIIKTSHSACAPEKVEHLNSMIRELSLLNQVIIIDEHLSHEELLNLLAAADVYISLHRGEGLGLGMLEAMSVGTPVVCTNYGGNLDFCKPDTAFLVNYKMRPCNDDFYAYRFVKEWAEPDVNQAADYLRQIYENPDLGKAKAAAAKAFIEDFYSAQNFEKDIRFLMEKMGTER